MVTNWAQPSAVVTMGTRKCFKKQIKQIKSKLGQVVSLVEIHTIVKPADKKEIDNNQLIRKGYDEELRYNQLIRMG